MSTVKSRVTEGKIDFNVPGDWHDGMLIESRPADERDSIYDEVLSTDEITRVIAALKNIEALDLTHEEMIEWDQAIQQRKETEKNEFQQRADQLGKAWE